MTRGTLRSLLSLVLLVVLPLASAVHTSHGDEANRPGVSANGHGPWSHCPPAQETPCIACAGATLFAPPAASAAALQALALSERLRDADPERARTAPRALAVGRSPPAA